MGQPAARVGDLHICPMSTGPVPHVGGPILPPGAPTVMIGNKPASRIGDVAGCLGPPDVIAKGSGSISIGGPKAARMGDSTAHGGVIVGGLPTVLLGDLCVTGNVEAGRDACLAAKEGRKPPPGEKDPWGNPLGTKGQSYNNCRLESVRQIINTATSDNIGQEALLNEAMDQGHAARGSTLFESGGSYPEDGVSLLANHGVGATLVSPSMANLESSLAQNKGVVADVYAGSLTSIPEWNSTPFGEGGHSVLVIGAKYDENGKLSEIVINDTGSGRCAVSIPADEFGGALIGGGNGHTVTDDPIWPR